MFTDAAPRNKARHKLFLDSDRLEMLPLPPDGTLAALGSRIEAAMKVANAAGVRAASDEFLRAASDFYRVPRCPLRVLAARPLRVREYSTSELFGDYHPDTKAIRVWMRTAVRKEVTSFGTFLSTLCHEFCHHLDFHRFGFRRFLAHTRLLWPRRGAVSPCQRYAAQAAGLGAYGSRTLADRLAAHAQSDQSH
jgi:hypothetical protein